jgi:mannose-1-phosphate guanylyltransferase
MPATQKAGKLWAVIMAGGSGTRFWPESRKKNPKQFLRIFGKKTLLEETVARLGKIIPPSRVLVITQKDKEALARKLLKKVPAGQILGEPCGRNTAPCAILAAAIALKKDPGAVIALLPADHRIENIKSFQKALQAAGRAAARVKFPVTFGIKPSFPHTGFGYLEMAGIFQREGGLPVYHLKRFHEKPSHKKAAAFVKSGKFLWNSGMFVWRADELLKAAKKYLPGAYQVMNKISSGSLRQGLRRHYQCMPNISIDYGLMEKMRGKILTLPVDFGWNDVGGWGALADLYAGDKDQNISLGPALFIQSEKNIIKSHKRLVVLLGIKDQVVVDTEDALLICPRSQTESIRKVVEALKQKKLNQYL